MLLSKIFKIKNNQELTSEEKFVKGLVLGVEILTKFGNHITDNKHFLNSQKKEERIKFENQINLSYR